MTAMPVAGYLALLYFGSEMLIGLLRPAKAGARSPADRSSTRVLWILIPVSMFFGFQMEFGLPAASWGYQPWINVLGIAITLAGLAFRWYSIIYLGRFFTVDVAIAADHRVIDTGPYRLIRHPSYSGAVLALVGLGMCYCNWLSLALVVIPPSAAFLWRINIEERALTSALGEAYANYKAHTRRLIPLVY